MDRQGGASDERPPDERVDVEDVLDQLSDLEETMTTPEQREELRDTRQLLAHVPGGDRLDGRISKYTTRDAGEAAVGSIIFALPLLVEDGVFEIADHFLATLVAGIPVYFVANVAFVVVLTAGLIYAVDIREVAITRPILGVVPRRLVGVLAISFLTAAVLMAMWGRLGGADAAAMETLSRITVIWAPAALGASLGDILPGESKGTDITLENLDDIVDLDD